MVAINRETARDALTALLSASLVGAGKPAQAVYGYEKGALNGESPVVLVMSAGSERIQRGMGSAKYRNTFRYAVNVYVADADSWQSWTEQNVEDALDLIERTIADVVAANRDTANWTYLKHADGFSSVVKVVINGEPYVMETILLEAQVDE